uniref:Poly [ADP-ribose] polymerase n=1 Tax=Latimeria chalumnae TaxID=7897 RepID=H3AJI3_LATCH
VLMGEDECVVEVFGIHEEIEDELLMLYFENRRRSGGGSLRSFTRCGSGAVLVYESPAVAQAVLQKAEHVLQGHVLSVRRAPPKDPGKLVLRGLKPQMTSETLELYIENISGLECGQYTVHFSPGRDLALIQLLRPLSPEEFQRLVAKVARRHLDGASVMVQQISQTDTVVVENLSPTCSEDILSLYFENRRSGGGPVKEVTMLPGGRALVSFQDPEVVQRVLQRQHKLDGQDLVTEPYYDFLLPPESSAERSEGGDDDGGSGGGGGSSEIFSRGPPPPVQRAAGRASGGVPRLLLRAPGERAALLRCTFPSLRTWPGSLCVVTSGSTCRACLTRPKKPAPSPSPTAATREENEKKLQDFFLDSVIHESVITMEPGMLRYLQENCHELLAGIGQVSIFPLDGGDVTGFRISGDARACQATDEFLRCIMASVSSRTVTLDYPGVARFLRGDHARSLLKELEAKFKCVICTERLCWTPPLDSERLDFKSPEQPERSSRELRDFFLELIKNLIAVIDVDEDGEETLREVEGEDGEDGLLEDAAADTADPDLKYAEKLSLASLRATKNIEEDAELYLALQYSMETSNQRLTEEEELQKVLELSRKMIEEEQEDAVEAANSARLVIYAGFDSDLNAIADELERAIKSKVHEERLENECLWDLSEAYTGYMVRLERKHAVCIAVRRGVAIIRGFLDYPIHAICDINKLVTRILQDEKLKLMEAGISNTVCWYKSDALNVAGGTQESVNVDETSEEFREIVKDFYDTLEDQHNKIRIIKVQSPVLYTLEALQMDVSSSRLEAQCEQKPGEPFHRMVDVSEKTSLQDKLSLSLLTLTATLYGQGVYFAEKAVISVQDQYSPANAQGHKFVFVVKTLTGDYTKGTTKMKVPPLKENCDRPLRYDSLVDNPTDPSIFVIFNDTQAYPQYLITC